MLNLLNRFVRKVRRIIRPDCPYTHSFSQDGEDMILDQIFWTKLKGVYVDVGAHHPIRFSNTYRFYLRGWTGINIDAAPGSMSAFHKFRPKDTNLELAIAEHSGRMTFHIFNEPALNTFDATLAKERDGQDSFRIISTKMVPVRTLSQVLDEHLPVNQEIDFLSVDVEGFDLAVLRSNDWKRFRPEYILAEDCAVETVEQALNCPIAIFLRSVGYTLFAKTSLTQIFRRISYLIL